MSKKRYLVSAYYSEWVEATSEANAEEKFESLLSDAKMRDFVVEVQDEDDATE